MIFLLKYFYLFHNNLFFRIFYLVLEHSVLFWNNFYFYLSNCFICAILFLSTNLVSYLCRMDPPNLLDPYYKQNHRGRRIVEGEVMASSVSIHLLNLCSGTNKNKLNVCRNCPFFVLKPMTSSRTCGITTDTLLFCRELAWTSYRTRFAAGFLLSTPRRSQLWLKGTISNH
jgi:hypothetical protein